MQYQVSGKGAVAHCAKRDLCSSVLDPLIFVKPAVLLRLCAPRARLPPPRAGGIRIVHSRTCLDDTRPGLSFAFVKACAPSLCRPPVCLMFLLSLKVILRRHFSVVLTCGSILSYNYKSWTKEALPSSHKPHFCNALRAAEIWLSFLEALVTLQDNNNKHKPITFTRLLLSSVR